MLRGLLLPSERAANFSQRCSRLRQFSAMSGERANLARRAHSAACSRQYLAYVDMTHSTRLYRDQLRVCEVG